MKIYESIIYKIVRDTGIAVQTAVFYLPFVLQYFVPLCDYTQQYLKLPNPRCQKICYVEQSRDGTENNKKINCDKNHFLNDIKNARLFIGNSDLDFSKRRPRACHYGIKTLEFYMRTREYN